MAKKQDLQYAVLGLGIFGSTVAKTLSRYNCEVTAIDVNMDCVQRLADTVTSAIQGDITDIKVLRNANVQECDVAIVGLGSHLEASILCILNLKELGVPYIVAKAKNKSYMQILQKIGADKVVRPEKEMGVVTAKGLLNRKIIDMVDIDDDYSIVEIAMPKKWIGKNLASIDLRGKFKVNVLGIRHADNKLDVAPSPMYEFREDDHLLIISDTETFAKFEILDN